MKFNSTVSDNDIKKDYSKYIVLAIGLAFVMFFVLTIAANLLGLAIGVIIKSWWIILLVIFGLLILRKFLGKRK
jgi:hypothetical protein